MDRALVAPGDRVLLAVSGGPDSVAMLDVVHRLGPELAIGIEVASVDHGLRPEAADEVALVGRLAEARRLPFHALALRLPASATPDDAREARYAALLARASGGRVMVAHTRDDQAETVLARMLRGSGLAGLSGIEPVRGDGVVRPMIDTTRAEILAHVEAQGLPTVVDPTNHDLRYQRARIRHVVLPMLVVEQAEVTAHLAALADEARRVFDVAEAESAAVVTEGIAAGRWSLGRLAALPVATRERVLGRVVGALGGRPGRRIRLEIARAIERGGDVRVAPGVSLTVAGGDLVVRRSGRATEPPT